MNDWNRIREHYRIRREKIFAQPSNRWGLDPYSWMSAGIQMTPIENGVWHDIRCEGMVLYPQYPVGRFFVDYANPVARVALECDGAAYHQDKEKDARRDWELLDMGWRVYRITGRDCLRIYEDEEDEDEDGEPKDRVYSPATELLRRIDREHNICCRSQCDYALENSDGDFWWHI